MGTGNSEPSLPPWLWFRPSPPPDRPQRSESSLTLPPPLSCAPPPWACPPPSRLLLALQQEEGLALRCEFPPWGWAAWSPSLHSDSGPALSPGRERRRTLTGPSGRGAWQRSTSVQWVSLWEWGLRSHVRVPASASGALPSRPCPGDLPLAASQTRGRAVWVQLLWGGLSAVPLLLPSEAGAGGSPLNGGMFLGFQGSS